MNQPLISSSRTSHSHQEMMKLILEDDILFQDLMTRIKRMALMTNEGVAIALHSSILEEMAPEIKSKYPSLNSEDLPSDTRKNVAWPLPNPTQALHQVVKLLPARVRTKTTDSYPATSKKLSLETRNSKWKSHSDEFVDLSSHKNDSAQRLALVPKSNSTWKNSHRERHNINSSRDYSFQKMNLHDIKYTAMEDFKPKRNLSLDSVTSCITAYSRNRRKSIENLKLPKIILIESLTSSLSEFSRKQKSVSNELGAMSDTNIYGEEGEEEGTIRRSSLWTEETVEELYDETVDAVSRRNSCWTEETVKDLYEETLSGRRLSNWSAETRSRQLFYDGESMEDFI